MNNDYQYCTFHLGDLFLGVEVQKIQEVIRYQEMTPVPLTSPVVQGLINLRGQIVTAIDLRRRLELPPRQEGQLPMNVVKDTFVLLVLFIKVIVMVKSYLLSVNNILPVRMPSM